MKFKKIFQKAAAVVMAAVTVFSVLPATTAFAAVGDVGTISFSHTYDGNGNAMRYNSSANINGYGLKSSPVFGVSRSSLCIWTTVVDPTLTVICFSAGRI